MIVILATVHEYQHLGHFLNDEFEKRLLYLKEKFDAKLVMEEWSEKKKSSFPAALASKADISWLNIGTPIEEQFRTFSYSPVCHPAHDGTLPPDFDAPMLLEYGPFEKQENREVQMLQNIEAAMANVDCGILILGVAHLHSMFTKLKDATFEVVAYHWFELLRLHS